MRAAAILAGSLVAIGAYLFIASFLAASTAAIAIGSLAIASGGAVAAVATGPTRARSQA